MVWEFLLYNSKIRYLKAILIGIAFLLILPLGVVLADQLGGYISEKLIDSTSAFDSRLVVDSSATNKSYLDIVMFQVEDYPNPYLNPDSTEYKLNELIPLALMLLFVVLLIAFFSKTEFSLFTILIAAVFIYIFYAIFPTIQSIITGLLGG